MDQVTSQRQFHTIDEFKAALSLTEAEWAKLKGLARNRCRVGRPGEEEEVLQDAIYRVLEGKRKWPKGLNLYASEDTSAADLVLETEIVTHVMALFDGDDDAEALAEGIMDGWEKQDLLSLFDGDTTRYETVRKRFKRKVNAHPELKSMIHGE